MATITEKARIARSLLHENKLDDAVKSLEECFSQYPAAWWLLMEISRIKLRKASQEKKENPAKAKAQVFFEPDYKGNSYQSLLYSESKEYGASAVPSSALDIHRIIAAKESNENVVFHQHWLREIYRGCADLQDGINRVDRYISSLKTLKAFGIPVVWTVHNLLDHDLAEFEKQVCKYAIKSVASVADTILIHTKSTSTLLGEAIGLDVSSKCKVVEHPLYEELLSFQKKTFPKEFDPAMVQGKKVILSLGMIRPYKGVSDLLIAYDQLLSTGQAEDSCLVIAGHMLDDDVRKRLEEAKKKYPDRVFAVPRKLSEEEMAALYSVADLAAMPYKAILISGSYYLATTFSVPSIVPNIGMFIDEINHGVTGLKYEPGGNGLLTALKNAISKNKNELKKIGDQAFQTYKYRTSAWFSKTYFECVLDKNDNGSKKA